MKQGAKNVVSDQKLFKSQSVRDGSLFPKGKAVLPGRGHQTVSAWLTSCGSKSGQLQSRKMPLSTESSVMNQSRMAVHLMSLPRQ